MNSTGTPSPLTSLFMSLGRSLDINGLELSTDEASGLSDFSNVLQSLSAGLDNKEVLIDSHIDVNASLSGHSLPLSMSEYSAINSESVLTADDLIEQIQTPVTMAVSQTSPMEKAILTSLKGETERADAMPAGLDKKLEGDLSEVSRFSTEVDENDVSALFVSPVAPEHDQVPTIMGPVASLPVSVATKGATAFTPTVTSRSSNKSLDSDVLSAGILAEKAPSYLEGELSGEFRPVTLGSDNGLPGNELRFQKDGIFMMASGQSVDAPTVGGHVAAKSVDVAFATANIDSAQMTTEVDSDAYEGLDVQADESLEQKLQTQLRERLEFGQDKKAWGGVLGARLMTMVADDVQQARIQLDPPELGSLEIKLHIQQDQASVHVSAQNLQVKDVLDASAQRLRDALNEQGIELAEFSVDTNAGSDTHAGAQGESDSEAHSDSDNEWQDSDDLDSSPSNITSSNSLLDTFA